MSRYAISDEAAADIDEVVEYLIQYSEPAAKEFLEEVNKKGLFLSQHPRVGAKRDELIPGLRIFTLWRRYVVFFREVDDGIEFVRIVDGSRDLPRLFEDA